MAAQACNEHALRLIEASRLDEAEAELRRALDADPYFGPAHCNLGVVLLQVGRFYEAGWQLHHACQLMPKASQPRANLGLLYETVGRYGAAEEQLRGALRLSPEDIEVIGHLARVQVRQGKQSEETTAWLETIAVRDDDDGWRQWARRELIRVRSDTSECRR